MTTAHAPKRTPFDTGAPQKVADITPRQVEFLRSLMMQKAQIKGVPEDQATLQLDMWIPTLSKADASRQIDEALDFLRHNKTAAQPAQPDLEDGFYELANGAIVKVLHAIHGSGRQYGQVLNTETKKFEMVSGILRDVRATGRRIDTDPQRAAELGKLYGICMVCGLTLTDQTSIERGIGPICLSKRGW